MLVYLNDVRELLDRSIKKFEAASKISKSTVQATLFWRGLRDHIFRITDVMLSDQTLYKSYWLKSRSHESEVIGCSLTYLDALTKYVYDEKFLQRFNRAHDGEDENLTFPLWGPMYPATPLIKFPYRGYTDMWIKDEGTNFTGVHCDRLSHEIYREYNKIIREQLNQGLTVALPRLSLLTTGRAGLSLQYLLRSLGLPDLKVLIDKNTPKSIRELLKQSRAEIYETNLYDKNIKVTSKWILEQTNNTSGIDATMGDLMEPALDRAYEWLAYELLNVNPQIIVCPYGSGRLFKTILRTFIREVDSETPSKRFFGDKDKISPLILIGGGYHSSTELKEETRGLRVPFDLVSVKESKEFLSHDRVHSACIKYPTGVIPYGDKKFMEKAMTDMTLLNLNMSTESISSFCLFLSIEGHLHKMMKERGYNQDARIVFVNTGEIKRKIFLNM